MEGVASAGTLRETLELGYNESPLQGKLFQGFSFISSNELSQLTAFSDPIKAVMGASNVFDRRDQTFQVQEEVRKSKLVDIHDYGLRDFVKSSILPKIESLTGCKAQMARSHVTFVKYDIGDYFHWHNDFEKIVINDRFNSLEMHMLICIEGCQEGGELEVESAGTLREACTTGGFVLFDKMLKHRALEVKQGTKLVMLVDVMVTMPRPITQAEYYVDAFFKDANQQVLCTYELGNFKTLCGAMSDEQRAKVKMFVIIATRKSENLKAIFDSGGLSYAYLQYRYDNSIEGYYRYDNSIDFWELLGKSYSEFDLVKDCSEIDAATKFLATTTSSLAVQDINHLRGLSLKRLNHVEDSGRSQSIAYEKTQNVSFTYHCNESNFSEISLHVSCGFIKSTAVSPKKFPFFYDLDHDEEEEEEEEEEVEEKEDD